MNKLLDLSDSELINPIYLPDQQLIRICLRSWDEKEMIIDFTEAIGFCFLSYCDPSSLQITNSSSGFMKDALELEYDTPPDNHGFSCYEFFNYDDIPFIKIIAKNFEVKIN
jgi:hypothetical protein